MKPGKALISFFLPFALSAGWLHAQNAIAPAGGSIESAGGYVSFTAGQIAYLGIETTGGSVYEGVQQPFYIVGVEEEGLLPQFCILYPNPSNSDVTLKVEGISIVGLSYQLFGPSGLLIVANAIRAEETTIPLHAQPAGVYFLNVQNELGDFTTFKIIKTY